MKCSFPIFCNPSDIIHISDTAILIFEIIMIIFFVGILAYLIKIKHKRTLKNLLICLIAVVLFELMIQPLVINARFSSWTYYFYDMSFIVTLGWVFIVSVSISLVDFAFPKEGELKRFFFYICVIFAITAPLEIFLVETGVRVYSDSLLVASSGIFIPFTIVPIDVIFAIPIFFILVVGFIKYWEEVLDEDK